MEKVKVTIKNESNVCTEEYFVKKIKEKIIYYEKNCKTTIFLNNFKIIRENDEYVIELNFIPNKITNGKYLLKKENSEILLEIMTDYLIIDDNLIILKYKVITTDQDVIFKLEYVK